MIKLISNYKWICFNIVNYILFLNDKCIIDFNITIDVIIFTAISFLKILTIIILTHKDKTINYSYKIVSFIILLVRHIMIYRWTIFRRISKIAKNSSCNDHCATLNLYMITISFITYTSSDGSMFSINLLWANC